MKGEKGVPLSNVVDISVKKKEINNYNNYKMTKTIITQTSKINEIRSIGSIMKWIVPIPRTTPLKKKKKYKKKVLKSLCF